jgi:hypothetical protein
MAERGDSYFNPVSRTRLVFVELPRDNGGIRMVMDWFVAAGEGLVGAAHYHAGPDGFVSEKFELVSGTALCRIGGREHRADAPHTFDIPCNTVHVHPRNAGQGEMHVRQTILLAEPDLPVIEGAERFFETVAALAQKNKVNRNGDIRDPLQSVLTLSETLLDPTWLPVVPQPIQRMSFGLGAAVARMLGYKAHHLPVKEAAAPLAQS